MLRASHNGAKTSGRTKRKQTHSSLRTLVGLREQCVAAWVNLCLLYGDMRKPGSPPANLCFPVLCYSTS
jgi:hypothetical protein